jgi:hypothetical protein
MRWKFIFMGWQIMISDYDTWDTAHYFYFIVDRIGRASRVGVF